ADRLERLRVETTDLASVPVDDPDAPALDLNTGRESADMRPRDRTRRRGYANDIRGIRRRCPDEPAGGGDSKCSSGRQRKRGGARRQGERVQSQERRGSDLQRP